MNVKLIIIISIFLTTNVYSDELKTQENFEPIKLEEGAILMATPMINSKVGLAISGTTTLTGLIFSIINSYELVDNSIKDPGGLEQNKSMFSFSISLILTSISIIVLDYFISLI